jgi:hypothetical protein
MKSLKNINKKTCKDKKNIAKKERRKNLREKKCKEY